MVRNGQLIVLRRGIPGCPALVDFETMRKDVKKGYIVRKGDPRAEIAAKTQKSILEDAIVYSNAAYEFFSVKYRYDGDKKLPPAKIDEYTLNVRIMNALLSLRDGRKANSIGGGGTRINVWEKLCKLSNDLLTLKDPNGRDIFPHNLPKNWKALKRKCEQYEAARRISEEEGYRSVIHKSYGNKYAAVVLNEDAKAVMHKLISMHNNLNNVQIMEEYNKVASLMDWKPIDSPTTVENWRQKFALTTMAGNKGDKALKNTRMKQIHREAPTQAHVEVVITKDLSRLGRNSSLTGLYINYTFPQYGVRYIAINDHFDTIDPNSTDNDIAGIKNWFNEFFAKDTSRKIRAVNKAKGERGERLTTNVPYGYKRDSDYPKKWVIDEEAAQVVKRIFALCMEGKGPSQIAALLEKEKVLNPTAYKQREGRKTPHQTPENEYRWHESTVAYILEYMEYTGCTVNFKTYTNSIYDKKQRENPMENRRIFYNTHPAIISLEVFDKVQEIRQQRHRRTATGKSNMFSGLVFCNDCKQKLYYSTTSYFEKRQDFFICSTHRTNKDKCSGHYIRAVVLEQLVWKHIQEVISVVTRYEAYFRSEMEQKLRVQSEETMRLCKKRLAQAERRIGELDRLFVRIYEDNVAGKLDDERFAMMSKNYTEEQKNLKTEVKDLQQQIHEQEQQAENIEQFVQRVKRNSTLTELTPYALRELIKAVYVDAPDKSSGKRRQKVHIEYDLVGYIPVDELLKAEQA